jgi:hypothetical protein
MQVGGEVVAEAVLGLAPDGISQRQKETLFNLKKRHHLFPFLSNKPGTI